MTQPSNKKTDVLNIRLDPALAGEIQRIAEWRGTSASDVSRELMRHGVAVERQLEAQELSRPYEYSKIERDSERGYLKVEARWVWYSPRELAEMEEERQEWTSAP
jgi:predicted transcriptional regulator